MTKAWLQRLLIINIFVQSGIIVTGAIVRVSGSGLGCPTWPQCVQGSYTPTVHPAESWHTWVEYSNRLLTGVLMVVAISVLFGVWMHTKDRASRRLATAPLALTFGQAILGGITVITGLNPYTVSAHFLLSTFIVHLSVRLWWRVRTANQTLRLSSPARRLLASAWQRKPQSASRSLPPDCRPFWWPSMWDLQQAFGLLQTLSLLPANQRVSTHREKNQR